jgi:hypothetical protein
VKTYQYKPKKKLYNTSAYLGIKDNEEFYLKPVSFDCGCYFGGLYLEGLRPTTEDELRERARETEPEDIGIDVKSCGEWFDYNQFREDMESDWHESADCVRE